MPEKSTKTPETSPEKKTTPAKPRKKRHSKKNLKKLVIVESPSKASTIKKYLGSSYEVKASVGHLIDLPKSRLGVNKETFEPDYISMRDKSKIIKDLRHSAKYASEIILASDPDREGEAIAWHLKNDFEKRVLSKIKDRKVPIRRVRFSEITKSEIKKEIKNTHDINLRLVNAQQGRRVIDRLFGYELSPLLWKKIKSRLSAGRVQSVALRIICEREEEIEKFNPEEYWNLSATFKKSRSKFEAQLVKIDGKKAVISNSTLAETIEKELLSTPSIISNLKSRTVKRSPNAPFITSTLQQTANNLLGYPSVKTMRIAQGLYEGVDMGKIRTGLITYMRTDSTRISDQASLQLTEFITQKYGPEYLPDKPHVYKNKKNAQDAHEAIRPTDVSLEPDAIKKHLTTEQYKLYRLIWTRFVASQIKASQNEQYTIEIKNGNKILTATTSKQVFAGYTLVYDYSQKGRKKSLPHNLEVGDSLELQEVKKEQKFTEPPARYSDASMVKILEELGIGRPSTYAATIFTLTKRYYVKKEKKSLVPTILGRIVNDLLVKHFPDLINARFTASMEEKLDEVEEGKLEWKDVVRNFYTPFNQVLSHAYEHIEEIKGIFDEETDEVCEKCGGKMVKKLGKYGFFLACSNWPECRNTRAVPLGKCPKCENGQIVQKKGKRGRTFYGCSTYPDCDFTTFEKPSEESCPNDGSVLFHKRKNKKEMLICLKEGCGYEKTVD